MPSDLHSYWYDCWCGQTHIAFLGNEVITLHKRIETRIKELPETSLGQALVELDEVLKVIEEEFGRLSVDNI